MKAVTAANFYKHLFKSQLFSKGHETSRCISQQLFLSSDENNCNEFCSKEIPKHAQVVICGGGIVGTSVAYHLARDFGWQDVVLLEQSW